MLGALALSFSMLAPLPIHATEAAHLAPAPTAPRCTAPACVQLRSATLVIPGAAGSSNGSLARHSAPNSIVYGTCDLSSGEMRSVSRAQFHAREALRVQ